MYDSLMPISGAVLAGAGAAALEALAAEGADAGAEPELGDCCEQAAQAQATAAARISVVRGMEHSRGWKTRMMHRSRRFCRSRGRLRRIPCHDGIEASPPR